MHFGYTILYVADVPGTVARFEAAFGLTARFVTPDGQYAEIETGATTLSFAELEFGRSHFSDSETRASFDRPPSRFEIGFVTADVPTAYAQALDSGMEAVVPPTEKPWGQTVAWVRDREGILVELATPM